MEPDISLSTNQNGKPYFTELSSLGGSQTKSCKNCHFLEGLLDGRISGVGLAFAALLLEIGGFSSIGAGIAAGAAIVSFVFAVAAEFATTLVPVIIRVMMMVATESAAEPRA